MRLAPRTLRGRLALFYALVLVVTLGGFAITAWRVFEMGEAEEPPEVRALEPPDHTDRRLVIAFGAALPVALLFAVGGATWVARRGLAPLDEVVRTAERVGADTLHERVAPSPGAGEEIARLIVALNGMLARLDQSVAGMRRFTADASHELRTPIAALRGELEVTLRRDRSPAELRGTIETSLEELGRLSRLVEGLLTLARADSGGLPLAHEPIDLVALARRAVEPYEAVMAARALRLRWDAPATLPARGDPLWIGRALANLIDNACKFTPDGDEIVVTLRRDGALAACEVDNRAPAPADAERLFERFYRGEAARAGTDGFGLGLPLAREIARGAGGDLTAAHCGGTLKLSFTIPVA